MTTEVPLDDNPSPAAQPAATDGQLVAQIRDAIDAAHQAGRPTPGRPALVRLTGATDYAVRKAQAELAAEPTSPGEAGDTPSPPADPPAAKPPPGGRIVALAGFFFGTVMSIAANVLHTWLPADHQPPDWSPDLATQIGAAVWPIGLVLSVEVLSRVRWPRAWLWTLARYGGTGTVALGSAAISYGHLRDVLLAWQYGPVAAAVGPLVIDGLMVTSGFALLAISHARTTSATADRRSPVR